MEDSLKSGTKINCSTPLIEDKNSESEETLLTVEDGVNGDNDSNSDIKPNGESIQANGDTIASVATNGDTEVHANGDTDMDIKANGDMGVKTNGYTDIKANGDIDMDMDVNANGDTGVKPNGEITNGETGIQLNGDVNMNTNRAKDITNGEAEGETDVTMLRSHQIAELTPHNQYIGTNI